MATASSAARTHADLPLGGAPATVAQVIGEIERHRSATWAWTNYLDSVRALISAVSARSVIEIGGGRSPAFAKDEIESMQVAYTCNDISERELSLSPPWVSKAHFDVQSPNAGDIEPFAEQFDFAFSQMVMEHVANYERAYRNIYRILRPGGVAIAFHPVLYSFPFIVNRLIPEAASEKILKAVFPNRTDTGTPKFPAVYSGCRISGGVRAHIRNIGFTDVWQIPFFGHNYYSRFPGIRSAHAAFTRAIENVRFTPLATFAFTVVRK